MLHHVVVWKANSHVSPESMITLRLNCELVVSICELDSYVAPTSLEDFDKCGSDHSPRTYVSAQNAFVVTTTYGKAIDHSEEVNASIDRHDSHVQADLSAKSQ